MKYRPKKACSGFLRALAFLRLHARALLTSCIPLSFLQCNVKSSLTSSKKKTKDLVIILHKLFYEINFDRLRGEAGSLVDWSFFTRRIKKNFFFRYEFHRKKLK